MVGDVVGEGQGEPGGADGDSGRNGGTDVAGAVAGRVAAWELAAEPSSARRARELTRRTLRRWGVGDPADVDDIVLMVDELIANAVVHGAGPVRLRLLLDGPLLRGEVGDGSPLKPRPTGVDPGGLDWSEAGRGLLLVGALAAEFGAEPAGPGRTGKTVWFTRLLHTPPGPERAAGGRGANGTATPQRRGGSRP